MSYDPLDIVHDFLPFGATLINNAYEIRVYTLPKLYCKNYRSINIDVTKNNLSKKIQT